LRDLRGVYARGTEWHNNAKWYICVDLDGDLGEESPERFYVDDLPI